MRVTNSACAGSGVRTAATAFAVRPFIMSRVIVATAGSLF